MENEEDVWNQTTKKIIQIFSEFMMRITKFEELVSAGNKFLICFQQALGFLGRPSIEKTSSLVEQIIKAHNSKRVLSYGEAGCVNAHDVVQNVSKLRTCHLGLQGLINEAKSVVTELQGLLDDATLVVQNATEKDANHYLDSSITLNAEEEVSSSDLSKRKVIDYAGMIMVQSRGIGDNIGGCCSISVAAYRDIIGRYDTKS